MRRYSPARIRTALATAAFAVAMLVAPSAALATKTLGLSAGIFKYNVTAGSVKSGEVVVMNSGNEPLHVMVYSSDQQVDDKQPGLCGTSARAATKERRGSAVSTADDNRRGEGWLVPKGTKLPAGFKDAKDLSTKDMQRELKKLGCPR